VTTPVDLEKFVRGVGATADEPPENDVERGTTFTPADVLFFNFTTGGLFTLDEAQAKDMAEMLDNDGKASQIEAVLTLPLSGLDWELKAPPDDRGQTKWLADFLGTAANQGGMTTPMDLIISQMTSAETYSKAYFEKVWTVDGDGHQVYDKVAFRPAQTCNVIRDPKTGTFQGFQQNPVTVAQQTESGLQPILFEPKYSFVHINGLDRDPIKGTSSLRIPFWCYKQKQKMLFLLLTFLEGQALPRTVVEANEIGTATGIARKVAASKNSSVIPVANNGGAQAKGQMIYTIDSSGRGSAEFMNAIAWLEQTALDSVLAGFTGLASAAANGRGSNSLADTMSNFFLKSRQKKVREMEFALRNWMLADLIRWNFGPDVSVPKLKFAPMVEADLQISMDLLNSMASRAGVAIFPQSFNEELILNVSRYLGLDIDKIREDLRSAAQIAQAAARAAGATPAEQQAAGLGSTVNRAMQLVQGQGGADGNAAAPPPAAAAS
jgi:hypothetical protein